MSDKFGIMFWIVTEVTYHYIFIMKSDVKVQNYDSIDT